MLRSLTLSASDGSKTSKWRYLRHYSSVQVDSVISFSAAFIKNCESSVFVLLQCIACNDLYEANLSDQSRLYSPGAKLLLEWGKIRHDAALVTTPKTVPDLKQVVFLNDKVFVYFCISAQKQP